ncbi:enoylhydratase isomerase [Diaporthe amygdali]|uniref:enoylhydratase isomerase n=1 Tax=Phomopsis amygdali TaxID=1214568 RepID=UPI0022FE0D1F|nr:enoylhydratase isomerase [Diaporthe amygdali]KAJ0122440.1 enoylhydratase isomerase [Diaporthe amygdali]
MASLPDSYQALSLPAVRLSHHPPSSKSVTPIIMVILNRPKYKNAFNGDMIESLEKAFGTLSSDPRVKCIVFAGSDPENKIFCAGMDMFTPLSTKDANDGPPDALGSVTRDTHRDGGGRVSLAIYRCQKPVIAALNGSAVGVGITMTLPCHIRVAAAQSRVGFVFARRGLVMEACSSFFLPRLVGAARALHLVTTGAVYRPTDRVLDGLFTEVVDDAAGVLPRALQLAEGVARDCSVVSVVTMRDMIFRAPGSAEEAHLLESKLLYDRFRSADVAEGVTSFLEKREPRFQETMEENAPSVYPWWEDKLKGPQSKL